MQKIKDLAASNAVTWGTIADSIDANFSETITEHQDISGKQDKLVSGVNIKTVNGQSILGSGNITQDISGKQDKLVSGVNIKTVNGTSILGGGNITIEGVDKKVVVPPMRSHLIPLPVDEDYYAGKKIGFIGDSITAGVGASTTAQRYTTVLVNMLGAVEVNKAVSGTVLCTGGHRTCNIDKLTASNLTGCSVVLIMMGINDWDQAKSSYYSLGEYGSTDTTTIYGAVDMWCKRIDEIRKTEGFEDTKFYFITPIVTSWNNSVGGSNWDQNKTNIHGFKLRDLCQAIINVCADYEIPVLDMNKYSGIYYNSASDNTTSLYFGDGIHPNSAGHEQIAKALYEYLLENLTYASQEEANKYAINYLLQCVLADARKVTYPTFGVITNDTVAIEGITLTPTTLNLVAGQTATITYTLSPSDTTQTSVIWSSSNTSIAAVNEGVVTALAEGSAIITCRSVDNSEIYAAASVTVVNPESTDITGLLISESTKTVTQGETATLSVSYVPSSTTQTGVVWSSDDEAVATVVGNGDSCTVTAVGEGQCNIIATSTVNSSIKANCFFTTSKLEDGTPDSATWTLGNNVSISEDGIINGTSNAMPLQSVDNLAIYNMPLLPGMEVEVVNESKGNIDSNFILWGVDTTKNLDEIHKSGNFTIGKFNIYYDSTKAPVKSILGSTGSQFNLLETGANTSPRTAIIRRDENGTIKVIYNGTETALPTTYAGYQTSCSTEKLYVFIGGVSSQSTWKMTYFGESRGTTTEPEPEEPETPTPDVPVDSNILNVANYNLGANVSFNSETGELSSSTSASDTLKDLKNAAIFLAPLKAGMEVEVQHTFPSSYGNFLGFGVDTTTDPSQIELGGGFPRGKFIVYYDAPNKHDDIETWDIATGAHSKLFTDVGSNVSPRIATIGRDETGKLYVKHNDVVNSTLPDYDCIETANNSENLYVWFGGCDNKATWKINYFGETRE